jgi:hypothetical protein
MSDQLDALIEVLGSYHKAEESKRLLNKNLGKILESLVAEREKKVFEKKYEKVKESIQPIRKQPRLLVPTPEARKKVEDRMDVEDWTFEKGRQASIELALNAYASVGLDKYLHRAQIIRLHNLGWRIKYEIGSLFTDDCLDCVYGLLTDTDVEIRIIEDILDDIRYPSLCRLEGKISRLRQAYEERKEKSGTEPYIFNKD